MNKKKKKILIITSIAVAVVIALTVTIVLIVLNKKKKDPEPEPTAGYEVSFGSEQLSMTIGEEKSLIASYTKQDGTELVFTSSDETVVKVDEYGRLTAIKAGTATITVSYGTASDSCVVTVGANGLLPALQLTNVAGEQIRIEQSTQLDLSGSVSFNGKTYTDAELTYAVSNENVGKVENGVFKPVGLGTTEITVTATWRGLTGASMSKTIVVEVKPELVFNVNNGIKEITLYTQTDKVSPFEITATYGGEILATSVEITQGSNYIKYDATNEEIRSRGIAGEAEISVSYELDGEDITATFPIHVKPTIYDYQTLVTDFSAVHGDVVKGRSLRELLGGNIVSATDVNGNALEVENNKVYGVQSRDDGKFETTITVCTATHGYKLNIQGATGVFAKAEDFAIFDMNASYASSKFNAIDESKPVQKWEGYYVLANNIDASNYTHKKVGTGLTSRGIQSGGYGEVGFRGTFDGQGYTVKGMTIDQFGIFGYVIEATVKNVAFVDVTLKDVSSATVLAGWIIDSNISNVYVSVANDTERTTSGSVFASGINTSTVKGCIVETKAGFGYPSGVNYGSFTYISKELDDGDKEKSSFIDVYVISGEYLGYYKKNSSAVPYYLVGENETLVLDGVRIFTMAGVKRYGTLADMKAAGNNYTYFTNNGAYWTIEDGAPVWNSLDGEYPSADEIFSDDITKKETVDGFDVAWL